MQESLLKNKEYTKLTLRKGHLINIIESSQNELKQINLKLNQLLNIGKEENGDNNKG